LTRVALDQGSLVVNSSQGGGTKDTWIIEDHGLDAMAVGAAAQVQIQNVLGQEQFGQEFGQEQ
jgi:uncharacterized circularly permuted ATP-grasp superfamily protein